MKVKWRFMSVERKEGGGVRGAWEGKGKEGKFGSVFVPFVNYLDTDVPCSSSSRGNDVPILQGLRPETQVFFTSVCICSTCGLFHLLPVF